MKGQMSGLDSSKGPKGEEKDSFVKGPKEGRTRPIAVVDSSRVHGEVVEIVSKNEDSIVEILKDVKRSQEILSVDKVIEARFSVVEIIEETLRGEINKLREEVNQTVEEPIVEVDETDEDCSFEDIINEAANWDENIPEQSEIVETAPIGSGLIGEDSYMKALDQYAVLQKFTEAPEVDNDNADGEFLEDFGENLPIVEEEQEQKKDSVSGFLLERQGALMVKKGRVCQKSPTKNFRKITKELTTPTISKEIGLKKALNVVKGEDFIFTDEDCVNFPDRLIASRKLDLSQVSNDVLRDLVTSKFLKRIFVNRLILSSYVDDRVLRKCREYERGENILGQIEFSDNGAMNSDEKLETFAGLFDDED
jgi:hypothetical protein